MRHALVVLIVLLLAGTLFWWFQRSEIEEMVPVELAGLVIINCLPESLDFLPKTRLGEWLDLEPAELQKQLDPGIDRKSFTELRENLIQAGIVIHSLERKESGSFRPHLTAFLLLRRSWRPYAEEWLRQEVLQRFGIDRTTIIQEGQARVYRGEQEGEIFYINMEKGWLVFSNSKPGWEDVQLTLAGRRPSLSESPSFQDVRDRVDGTSDLFFYFSGIGLDQFLPEFGYSVSLDGDEVYDSYWEVER